MIYFHNRVAFKNGNEIIITHVNSYDDNFVYTSYKAFPLNTVIGKFTFENGINYQDKSFSMIKNDLENMFDIKLNQDNDKHKHQIKFRSIVMVKYQNVFIIDCVAKVDDSFVYFDDWKTLKRNVKCIISNKKRYYRFKFNKHISCNYNVNDVPLYS